MNDTPSVLALLLTACVVLWWWWSGSDLFWRAMTWPIRALWRSLVGVTRRERVMSAEDAELARLQDDLKKGG